MTFWQLLDKKLGWPAIRMPDARGWIGLGCFLLVCGIFYMIRETPAFLDNDAFLVLATAIIINGWNGGPVGWAYQATKSGGEAAESSARIAEQAATASLPNVVDPPTDAKEAARATADAADDKAKEIEGDIK